MPYMQALFCILYKAIPTFPVYRRVKSPDLSNESFLSSTFPECYFMKPSTEDLLCDVGSVLEMFITMLYKELRTFVYVD